MTNFFIRPDIVYTMPGMKDEIIFWEKDKATEILADHVPTKSLWNIQSSHYTNKVTCSKFCELRPRYVLLMKHSPKNQCKCVMSEKFMNILKGLSVIYVSSKFWHAVLCDSSLNSSCWQSNLEPYLWIMILKLMFHRKSSIFLRLVKTWKSFNAK